jgi:hypothetical protein
MSTDDPADPLPDDAIGPATPPPPKLPEVEQEPTEDIISGQPTPEEIVERATPAEDILAAEPSVDELLGRDRDAPGDDDDDERR